MAPKNLTNNETCSDCRQAISTFITDNKALMRRMHGTLVEPVADDEGTFQTPASTTFVKSVRFE
jgi:hypothetical protein